ncbi:protein mono-ADP-ribosyltransferase PARP12 [Sphaeramia orbicularis]|uniref:Poly (ADP-ribose) polymerase family, member 12a n=1 Tax=Sphaeramia orbicularis TaxID=375764 RepID=A0A673A4L9_9TELE|nr:protein mono-ADP-ribosyltransferase PARP12 [Sphaeramia orbicularis]
MTAVVSKFVTQTLCDNQGCLDFRHLKDAIAQKFTVADQVLRTVLFNDGSFAIQPGTQRAQGGQLFSPDSLVVAKTSLRICQVKAGGCLRCDDLHLCRYFVCGDCTFGIKCKNPHSLTFPHNAEILGKYGLQDLTEKQLFQLLLQNDPFLLPEICPHYNKGNGVHGSCRFNTSCTKLHMCQHYLQGDCKFGSSCKRSHAIDANGMRLFKGYSQDNIKNLYKIYRNKSIIMGQPGKQVTPIPVPLEVKIPTNHPPCQTSRSNPGAPTTSPCPNKSENDADGTEICLYSIRRHCRFNEKCVRVHWHLPYRWQVLDSDGVTWNDLPNMEDIEKAYCDPQNDRSCTDQPSSALTLFRLLSFHSSASHGVNSVDFMTMKYGGSPVRRLSTASSVSKPPQYILTTQWLWYWREDSGVWLEYGQDGTETPGSVKSETLEAVYMADRDAEVPFSVGKQQYILHLKDAQGNQLLQMYQQNLKYQTRRQVRRRPRFVSAQDVELKLNSSSSGSSTPENIPLHWDKNALPDFGYKLVLLSTHSKEYSMIEMLFKNTMPQSKINSIQRIQNPSLWKVFQWQKEQMKAKNGGKPVEEKHLFHGTDESLIEPICGQNFDWRMCGMHGTAYGKGSYFARDASYSARYSTSKGNQKIMFVAVVLVGDYTKGSSSYVRPPSKNSKAFYDSCVNSMADPSIFVIFEKYQIYPEYVINYL